jgi:hypothetical protein
LEQGYWQAYRDFYRWGAIARGAMAHGQIVAGLRHAAYAAGWKKFEPLWDLVIRARQASRMLPVLETILSEFGHRPASRATGALPVSWAERSSLGSECPPDRTQPSPAA